MRLTQMKRQPRKNMLRYSCAWADKEKKQLKDTIDLLDRIVERLETNGLDFVDKNGDTIWSADGLMFIKDELDMLISKKMYVDIDLENVDSDSEFVQG